MSAHTIITPLSAFEAALAEAGQLVYAPGYDAVSARDALPPHPTWFAFLLPPPLPYAPPPTHTNLISPLATRGR